MNGATTLQLTREETDQWRDPGIPQGSWPARPFFVARARNEWREGHEVVIVDCDGRKLWAKSKDGAELEWREPVPGP